MTDPMSITNSDLIAKLGASASGVRPAAIVVGTNRSGMSLAASSREILALMDRSLTAEHRAVAVHMTLEEARLTGTPILTIDSFPQIGENHMDPNAHEIPVRQRMNLPDEVLSEIEDWDNEPAQSHDYSSDDRTKRYGNNKFKPSPAHKRKIKKLAAKAKQKQRRLKGK